MYAKIHPKKCHHRYNTCMRDVPGLKTIKTIVYQNWHQKYSPRLFWLAVLTWGLCFSSSSYCFSYLTWGAWMGGCMGVC